MTSISNNRTAEGALPSPAGLHAAGAAAMAKSLPAGPIRRAPTHPGLVLADSLESASISMRSVAAAIGMSPTGLNKVLRGESPVTPETALLLARYLGTNDAKVWLAMQADHDLWHARGRLKERLTAIVPLEREKVAGLG